MNGGIASTGTLDVAAPGYSAPTPATSSRLAPPPAPAAASGASGGQVHVALETAVAREKMYFGNYEVQPMSTMRQRIAEHMVASKRVSAHVYSVDEIDMSKVAGLRAYPTLNASLDGTNIILHKEINVGIAVALDWGLLVPVVKNADEKNILGIQRNMNDLAERARSKK